jgi:outer membrane protein assembly factor BamB
MPIEDAINAAKIRRADAAPASGRFDRRPLYGIAAAGAIAEAVNWLWKFQDPTWQVILFWCIPIATALSGLLWWLFHSDLPWKSRLRVVGAVGGAVGLWFGCFRFTGFTGDLAAHFDYRWQQAAEAKADDYWTSQAERSPIVGGTLGSVADPARNQDDLPIAADDWPQFEGPMRDGIARGVRLCTDWEERPPKQLWRHPVGAGWSSFAVVGNYAFTQEQRGKDEGTVCYDAQTGKQLWEYLEPHQRYENSLAGVGPRATPTVAGSRLYVTTANGILNCLDARSGRIIWQQATAIEANIHRLSFGMSDSPLVYDKLVVVNPGGPRAKMNGTESSGRALIAYDRMTGKEVWASGDYQAGYASPVLATVAGVRQVVLFDGVGVGGYDAATGKELWRSPEWTNDFDINAAQPILLKDDAIFLSSGYSTGCILFDVKRSGSSWTVATRWKAVNKFKLKFNTGVCRDGFGYGLDEGILACLDLSNGKLRWKSGRYNFGQVLLTENVLLVVSEEGDVVLCDVSPKGNREITRFHAIDGKTWNHPAISGNRLFVRNSEEGACYDLGTVMAPVAEANQTAAATTRRE